VSSLPFGLYLHVPFCLQRCSYCDFFTMPLGDREGSFSPYLRALHAEIDAMAPLFAGRLLHTIFFGGGTPSLLRPEEMGAILERVRSHLAWHEAIEITVEVNPETLTLEKAAAYRAMGVNRLSIGIQSLDARALAMLGRNHDVQGARRCFDIAREAGFTKINLDLIWGRPGLTLEGWAAELSSVLAWGPDHLSLYELILEPGTPMTRSVQRGELCLPDDEQRFEMYRLTRDILDGSGMNWYEISNFCREGQICLHNLHTWQGHDYLGVGPGAHGFLGSPGFGRRRANPRNLPKYLSRPEEAPWEARSAEDAVVEALLSGLRIREGFDPSLLTQRYGLDLTELLGPALEPLCEAGYLFVDPKRWFVSPRGAEILDEIVKFLSKKLPDLSERVAFPRTAVF
jgi:oxygen-independent coproporphyrinogen-3 oxidase